MKAQKLVLCAMFAALIAIGAFLKVPVPVMPFTMQTMFVSLAGLLLGKRLGAVSVLVYIAVGLLGLPVFVNGGGPGYVLQPTFGYLIGFVLGAYLCGWMVERRGADKRGTLLLGCLCSLAATYALGLVYYFFITNFYFHSFIGVQAMLWYCFAATLPGDFLTSLAAVWLAKRILPVLGRTLPASGAPAKRG